MIRVLVADDQALVRSGFEALLSSADDIEVVGVAADGAEAVRIARRERPDVVLMDIRMPVMDGLAATRQLLSHRPGSPGHADGAGTTDSTGTTDDAGTRILILTTFDLDEYVFEAIRAGASGFLLKDALPQELLQAVRVIAAGEALLAPRATRVLIERFADSRPPVGAPGASSTRLAGLTERERDVLRLVGLGLSNAEISGRLFVGAATTKTHIAHLLAKLGARDRAQLVIAAYAGGLVAPPEG